MLGFAKAFALFALSSVAVATSTPSRLEERVSVEENCGIQTKTVCKDLWHAVSPIFGEIQHTANKIKKLGEAAVLQTVEADLEKVHTAILAAISELSSVRGGGNWGHWKKWENPLEEYEESVARNVALVVKKLANSIKAIKKAVILENCKNLLTSVEGSTGQLITKVDSLIPPVKAMIQEDLEASADLLKSVALDTMLKSVGIVV